MSGRQRNDDDLSAARSDFGRPDDRVGGVVSALHDDVGLEQPNEIERSILIE
jgi:hypothetical protein